MTRSRRAVALVIEESGATGTPESAGQAPRWLLVRRPPDDPDLPGVWGLPAGSHTDGETDEALVRRIGSQKLGVETANLGCLAEGHLDRPGYRLEMRLHAARIVAGKPSVPRSVAGVTQYSAWGWKLPAQLREGAHRGSLCCRLALDLANQPG